MRQPKYIVLSTYVLIFWSHFAVSQDRHYWTQQFGSRSALMGGMVVGGVRDTSAGFYNPGALGFVNEPSLSVSATAYQLESLTIDDGVGLDTPLKSNNINTVPILASGTLISERLPKHRFGYSLLTKTKTAFSMSARVDKDQDVIPEIRSQDNTIMFQGNEDFIGQLIADSEVTEFWGGLTWAYPLRNNISIGASGFLAFRNQTQSTIHKARAVSKNEPLMVSTDELAYLDFWHVRTLFKLGIAADFEALKLGMTITTPSIHLAGRGTVAGEYNLSNAYNRNSNQFYGILGSDRQEDLKTTYKSPFSIAMGFEYAVTQKTNLAGTVEWFSEQDPYDVITPTSHSFFRGVFSGTQAVSSRNDSAKFLKISDAANRVANFGIAIEHTFTETTKGYFSFRTDRETYNVGENALGFANWDTYHITIGAAFRRKRSELAVGLNYSLGRQDSYEQLANFAAIKEEDLLGTEQTQNTTATYKAFSILIGYTYFFDLK